MLEAAHLARRDAVLPGGGDGPVRVLPAGSRLSLRVKGIGVPDATVPFSPCGRRWPREARSDEGSTPTVEAHPSSVTASPCHLLPQGEKEGVAFLAFPINCSVTSGDRTLARLGPDEWLVLGPEADTDAIAAEIAAALGARFHALVDISHRQAAFEVGGERAADILNAGCPLDLHPSAFPPGSATRTLLGKAEIVLLRPGDPPVFRVEAWRSFAGYVHAFLQEAARDA